MRALVADDHPMVVDALTLYLREIDPNIEVLGASDIKGALGHLGGPDTLDLILLDFDMPGMANLEGLRLVCEERPGVPTVMIGGTLRAQDMLGALDRGAAGVIPKDYSKVAIVKALELILAGERHVPARLLGGADGLRGNNSPCGPVAPADGLDPLAALNSREREVLALLAEGLSNAGIGQALGMSANGANHHLKSIYRKLDVRKRTQAMAIYFGEHRRSA